VRKKVVGEDYVANALETGSSDFLRPLQQYATVCSFLSLKWFTIWFTRKNLCFEVSSGWYAGSFAVMELKLKFPTDTSQESAWGSIWTRPGLSHRDRSLLNLGMLTAMGKWTELGTHVRGAVRNGLSEVEIREALLQTR
jgi:4-carboxymuconolactone decarboxylase